jgi:MarR family transcriptional regulator, organic hydroperoxide resistance regulator
MHTKLVAPSGLKPDEFARLQRSIVALRDRLIEATAKD